MRIAIVSDIHSNLEAFQEVLVDIDRLQVDGIVSLGDNIGYGPEPEAVLQLIRRHDISSILGNHERGIVEPATLSWFNPSARRSLSDHPRTAFSHEHRIPPDPGANFYPGPMSVCPRRPSRFDVHLSVRGLR